MSNEQTAADAGDHQEDGKAIEEMQEEQTPVKIQLTLMELPDGSRYMALTTKPDKATVLAAVELFQRMLKQSDANTPVGHRAMPAYENARELAYLYELMERPKKPEIETK